MKKYGQADLMCYLVHIHITEKMKLSTNDEKRKIEEKCRTEIMKNYPSAMDREVGR